MLRCADLNDASDLGNVYCESWKFAYKGIIPDEYFDSMTPDIWKPKKINPDNYIVAEENEKIIGLVNFGSARDSGENCGELRAIYLLPEYVGQGYGRLLFSEAARELQRRGYTNFYLWVLAENFRARAFYEKMGMNKTETARTVNIGGKDILEVKYVSGDMISA